MSRKIKKVFAGLLAFAAAVVMMAAAAPGTEARAEEEKYLAFIGVGAESKAYQWDLGYVNDPEYDNAEIIPTTAMFSVGDTFTIGLTMPKEVIYTWWIAPVIIVEDMIGIDYTIDSIKLDGKEILDSVDMNAGLPWYYEATGIYNNEQAVRLAGGYNEEGDLYMPASPVGWTEVSYTITVNSIEKVQRDAVEAFVERLYNILLDREVDAEGLDYWTDILVGGADTGANVAAGIVFSEELENRNLTDEEFVRCMYLTVFNREPDPEGGQYWLDTLAAGETRKAAGRNLLNSLEFGEICTQYGIVQGQVSEPDPDTGSGDSGNTGTTQAELVRNFVKRLYSILLGREVDAEGLTYWSDILTSKQGSGAQVAADIVFSEELENRNLSDEEYLTCLYQTVFEREPDEGGKTYWLGVLAQGEPRNYVGRDLLNSAEFGDICKQYDIEQGTAVAPVVIKFWDLDIKGTFMELGKDYTYTTCSYNFYDEIYLDAYVEEYQVMVSDETHPAKEGYEWRIAKIGVVIDEVADYYGWRIGAFWRGDMSGEIDINKTTGDSANEERNEDAETGLNYFDTRWNGATHRIYYNSSGWSGDTDYYRAYIVEFLVPEGYDNVLMGLYDRALTFDSYGNTQDILWVDIYQDENTLFFRLD